MNCLSPLPASTGPSSFYTFDMSICEIWHSSEVGKLKQRAIHYLRSSSNTKPFRDISLNPSWSYSFFLPVTALYFWQNFQLIISHNANHHKEPELYLTLLRDWSMKTRTWFNSCGLVQCLALHLYNHWHWKCFLPWTGLLHSQNYFVYIKLPKEQEFHFYIYYLIFSCANYARFIKVVIF